MTGFPERLQYLRERKRISRKTLGELVGLSKNAIAKYERGEREPTASKIVLLAEHFEVSTDYLLGVEKNFQSGYYRGNWS